MKQNKQFWFRYFGHKDAGKVPPHLQSFGLPDAELSDADIFTLLTRVSNIDTLILSGTYVTPIGISYLSKLEYIGALHLKGLHLNDSCIDDLLQLKTITFLHIGHNNISEAGIQTLATLPNLKELIFSLESITAEKEAFYSNLFSHCSITICGPVNGFQ